MKEALLVVLVLFMSGYAMSQESKTVRLWRTSTFDQTVKIHIASFDNAKESAEFNWASCLETAALFAAANKKSGVKYSCTR